MGASGSGSTQSTAGTGLMAAGGIASATGVGAPVGIGLVAAGVGLSVWGALSSASDQADLDAKKAAIAQQQAAEIQAREVANENLRDQDAYRKKLEFGAAFAGSGKAGTGLGSQLEIQRQTDQQNMISNRDSQFQEQMLQEQAGIDTTLGQETMQAGYLNAAATVIGGASKVYSLSNPPSSPTKTGTQNFGSQPGV